MLMKNNALCINICDIIIIFQNDKRSENAASSIGCPYVKLRFGR